MGIESMRQEKVHWAYPRLSAAELAEIETALQEHPDAPELLMREARRTRTLGCFAVPCLILAAVVASVFWKWYAWMGIMAIWLLGSLQYYHWMGQRISKKTGLSEALAVKLWQCLLLHRRQPQSDRWGR